MIVVDTNIIAYFFINGDHTDLARKLYSRESAWCVPPLWRHEFLNVLATFAKHGGADIGEVSLIWNQATQLLSASEFDVDMKKALILAIQKKLSAYDAQYIVLANQLNCKLVTEDKKLINNFPAITNTMNTYCAN